MHRHSDESLARVLTRRAAQLTLAGAIAATPLAVTAGTASATDWDAIAQCESSGDWGTNTGNGYGGGLQFTDSTWKSFGGSGQPEDASRSEQIQVAERVKGEQGMGAWPVCSKKTGQTSSSSSSSDDSDSGSSGSESSASGSSSSGSSASQDSSSNEGSAGGPGAESIRAAAPSAVSPAGSHTVAAGDTLSSIASAAGSSVQHLAQRNGIADPDRLDVGQQLVMG